MSSTFSEHKNKKVLFITPWYPSRYENMLGLFVQRHAQAIAAYYQVSVISLHSLEDHQSAKTEILACREKGVEELRAYFTPPKCGLPVIRGILKIFSYVRSFLRLWKLYKTNNGLPDIVHVHVLTRAGILALFLKSRYGISYVITEHWSRYFPAHHNYQGIIRKAMTRLVVKNSAAVSTISNELAQAMKAHNLNHRNFLIVDNVVDTELFSPAEKKQTGIFEFIHISCFEDRSKNISGLLRIIKKLSIQRQDFHVSLVGNGIDFELMKDKAASLDIASGVVTFHGQLEGRFLAEKLAFADLLLITSHYENMPVVINEAFSCGVPVISTKVGGIHEHIGHSNGILVEPANEDQYVKRLQEFMNGKYHFDRWQIRQFAEKKYSRKAIIDRFEQLYSYINSPDY